MAARPRVSRLIGAVDLGSFRVSAMIAAQAETGEIEVLGSGYRASGGIRRGYVTEMDAATYAVRDALEKAEKMAGASVDAVWIGASGAGLASEIRPVEIAVAGRRIEEDDLDQLMHAAQECIEPDGRTVLHALPARYVLDGADGVGNPVGLYAERLGLDIHVMLAESAPTRNLVEAVQRAHLEVAGVVASPLATAQACLTAEERDLGVAVVELGGELTQVSVHAGGMLVGLYTIPRGSAAITDAIATRFGIRRFQAERLKCKHGSALASPADHREVIALLAPGEERRAPAAVPGAAGGDGNEVPRAELIAVIAAELDALMSEVAAALGRLGFAPGRQGMQARQVVLTGGGAEMAGLADYAQSVLAMPVRVGRAPALPGLAEAHSVPGFAALCGIVMHAASGPADIRQLGPRHTRSHAYGRAAPLVKLWGAMRRFF